jgi:hypothetical protein
MDTIIEPNDLFDFSLLSLSHPISIQGGAYFTKIQHNNKPVYIQTTKSLTRQGFVKTGKKYYCDLLFDQSSIPLIHWFENLEERCQQLILEKADTWFQSALEKSDVESAFNSIIRIFKSGKFYLVRTNIKTSSVTNEPIVKIYNENEIPMTYQEINNETNLVSILEIQGIKFTSRNFQIDIELKQMMVLDNEPLFDSCLIKNSKKEISKKTEENVEQPIIEDELPLEKEVSFLELSSSPNEDLPTSIELPEDNLETEQKESTISKEEGEQREPEEEHKNLESKLDDWNESLDLQIEELEPSIVEDPTEDIKEVTIEESSLENPLETITLKKPNQVYFELYKEARSKAKEAKKNLVLAYLEAKNIKKTYMLDSMDMSDDSDLDAEIDEISESELDGL